MIFSPFKFFIEVVFRTQNRNKFYGFGLDSINILKFPPYCLGYT